MDNYDLKELLSVLYKDLKKYLDLKFNYYKLSLIEKTIFLTSKLFSISLAFIIFPIILIFISLGAALYIGSLLGANYLGFFVISGVLLIFGLILFLLKKPIFIKPLIRTLIKILFKPQKPIKKDEKK